MGTDVCDKVVTKSIDASAVFLEILRQVLTGQVHCPKRENVMAMHDGAKPTTFSYWKEIPGSSLNRVPDKGLFTCNPFQCLDAFREGHVVPRGCFVPRW